MPISLSDLLEGSSGIDKEYLATNPWFQMSRGLASEPGIPMNADVNPWARFGMGAAQSFGSALTGQIGVEQARARQEENLAKRSALVSALQNKNADLSAYASDPATSDLYQKIKLSQALSREAEDQKRREMEAEYAQKAMSEGMIPSRIENGVLIPTGEPGVNKMDLWKAQRDYQNDLIMGRQEAADERKGLKGMVPDSLLSQALQTPSEAASLRETAQQLRQFDESGVAFTVKGKLAPWTKEYLLESQMDLKVKTLTKALEGARPSDYDAKTYAKILKGIWYASPKDTANLFEQAATILEKKTARDVDNAIQAKKDPEGFLRKLQAGGAGGGGGSKYNDPEFIKFLESKGIALE